VLHSDRRDELGARLAEAGIETAVHYPSTIGEQPAFEAARSAGELGVSTAAAREVLSLPCYAFLTEAEQQAVLEALATAEGTL
jgi:dTDP-4-amino-4,6-dideoxygalactose transaminase